MILINYRLLRRFGFASLLNTYASPGVHQSLLPGASPLFNLLLHSGLAWHLLHLGRPGPGAWAWAGIGAPPPGRTGHRASPGTWHTAPPSARHRHRHGLAWARHRTGLGTGPHRLGPPPGPPATWHRHRQPGAFAPRHPPAARASHRLGPGPIAS